ncbi:MAG TPA: PIN domain-containing protein [Burkholderiales bacterium]
MTGPCFVDANVFLCTQDRRDLAKHQRAGEWLDRLWRSALGRTSIQALSEFYAVSTRKFGVPPQIAWVEVTRYFPWDPQPIDEELLRLGREIELRYKLSWWDSMIVAAAQLQESVLLLTEDLQDGAVFGAVTVRSPFTLEVREAAAQYTVERSRPPMHRPRGRPRRVAAAL